MLCIIIGIVGVIAPVDHKYVRPDGNGLGTTSPIVFPEHNPTESFPKEAVTGNLSSVTVIVFETRDQVSVVTVTPNNPGALTFIVGVVAPDDH